MVMGGQSLTMCKGQCVCVNCSFSLFHSRSLAFDSVLPVTVEKTFNHLGSLRSSVLYKMYLNLFPGGGAKSNS